MTASQITDNGLGLSDDDLDLSDVMERVMEAAGPEKSWTPSELGRKIGAETARTRNILAWLVEHRYITSYGNGSWTRYMLKR